MLLGLLGLVPLIVLWYYQYPRQQHAHFTYTDLRGFKPRRIGRVRWLRSLILLRIVALNLIIIAIAKPQLFLGEEVEKGEGIDITLALDISGSMKAEDFQPNRLESAKEMAKEFMMGRPNDRFALVLFGEEAFTQCPLTTDHQVINSLFNTIYVGLLGESTAIGMGLALSVGNLEKAESKSKIVVLLTDGKNTAGKPEPEQAGQMAIKAGVKVYTIGIGRDGPVPFPQIAPNGKKVYTQTRIGYDDQTLKRLAQMTGGRYFHAEDAEGLRKVYAEIDLLETTQFQGIRYRNYRDLYQWFVGLSLLLLVLEFVLRNTIFSIVP